MAKENYNASALKVLEGLDAVRVRPGMYIGSTGVKGLHHILWEIVDNAVDEAANGYATKVEVVLYPDGSASVRDDGRGIPTDIHEKAKISGVELVFTQLHAGGKFDNDNYQYSGGLHGVGASVTNALSEWLHVEVYKGTVYQMDFRSYYDAAKKKFESGIPQGHLANTGRRTEEKGTFVRFKPDANVFETTAFQLETITKRIKELAFLNRGIRFSVSDLRPENASDEGETFYEEYCYEGGLSDFCKFLNENKTPLYSKPLLFQAEKSNILVEFAIQHTSDATESLVSFVNNIPTAEGGFHETGFRSGLTRALNEYARNAGFLKEKDANFLGEDFKEGLTAVLSVKMKEVQFEGQTKSKLGNSEARVPVETVTYEGILALAAERGAKSLFESIIKKAQGAAKVRLAVQQAKKEARAKSDIDNLKLVGKLAACTGKKPELNELFIVEGDSAGGTAKQARMRQFQAILPLRGKPLNVEKKKLAQVLENEEIRSLISAMGTGIGSDFSEDKLNYHKVIILSDADYDGFHIRSILLTFFFRYMRPLVNAGHIYIGMPPLYKIYKGDVVEYAYDDKELPAKIEKVGKGYQIQRYKGLGEMSAEQLWDTTMNPQTRNLMQVSIEDAAEAENMVTVLMGDRVEGRKEYLLRHASFNRVDAFKDIKDKK